MLYPLSYEGGPDDRSRSAEAPAVAVLVVDLTVAWERTARERGGVGDARPVEWSDAVVPDHR